MLNLVTFKNPAFSKVNSSNNNMTFENPAIFES